VLSRGRVEVTSDNALEIAPPTAECPVCHSESKRHSIARRNIRDISLDGERVVPVRVGVYRCAMCQKHFRLQTGLAEKGKHYSKRALEKSFVAVRDDKMTFTGLPNRLSRDFHIAPSKSTCHRWFHNRADKINFEKDYEPLAAESFSGAVAIDEVYDREFCIMFATDPLNRRPISFHICAAGSGKELEIFLRHLDGIGIKPEVLIVDGSALYQHVPQRVWPAVRIQLCTFHVIKNCSDDIESAIRTFCKNLSKGGKCPHEGFEAPLWWIEQVHQKAVDKLLIREHHIAFLTREESLSHHQRTALTKLCGRYPELQAMRDFHKDLLGLFQRDRTADEAWAKLRAMREESRYKEIPGLQVALGRLKDNKFEKMITFLNYENLDSTTNHVERTNRWFRKRQKTHYRNRTERTIRNMLKADLLGKARNSDHPVTLLRRDRLQEEKESNVA
jgi:Transposase